MLKIDQPVALSSIGKEPIVAKNAQLLTVQQ